MDGSPVCASMMFPNAEAPSARGFLGNREGGSELCCVCAGRCPWDFCGPWMIWAATQCEARASEREAKFQLSLNSIRSAALQQPVMCTVLSLSL